MFEEYPGTGFHQIKKYIFLFVHPKYYCLNILISNSVIFKREDYDDSVKDKTWDLNYAIKQENVNSSNSQIFPDLTLLAKETLHTKNKFLPLSNQSKENQTDNDHVDRNITLHSGSKILQCMLAFCNEKRNA